MKNIPNFNTIKGYRFAKKLFGKSFILFTIYAITVPVWAALLLDIIEFPPINNTDILKQIMPLFLITGLAASVLWRQYKAMPAFIPVIFYYTGLGTYGSLGWIALLLITAYAFIYMVMNGHIRSFLFIFLIVYSGYFLDLKMAIMNGVAYAFLRFIYMAIDHNVYVFKALGLKRSATHLLKAFFYWSPLLIFIIPLNYLTSTVNNKISEEVYRFTVVDSVKFYKNTSDIIYTNQFQLRPNVTSVLFLNTGQQITDNSLNGNIISTKLRNALNTKGSIDSSHQWMIKQFIDTSLIINAEDHFYSKYIKDKLSGKGSPIIENYFSDNSVDFKQIDESDTISSNALTDILSRRDTLRGQLFGIGLNSIEYKSNWMGETNSNSMVLSQLKNANNQGLEYIDTNRIYSNNLLSQWIDKRNSSPDNNKSHLIIKPTALILKDVAINSEPLTEGDLYENINVAMITMFKNFTTQLTTRVEEEIGGIDAEGIANDIANSPDKISKQSKDQLDSIHNELMLKLNTKEKECIDKINQHKIATHEVVTEEYNAIFPEPLLELEKCKWYEVIKHATNAVRRTINKRYSAQKRKTKAKIDAKIDQMYTSVKTKVRNQFDMVESSINSAKRDIDIAIVESSELAGNQLTAGVGNINFAEISNINSMIPDMIKKTGNTILGEFLNANKMLFTGLSFYSLFGTLSLLYLILQTYLYIFARVTVSKKNEVYVSLSTKNFDHPKGKIRKCGDSYTISPEEERAFYVSRKYEPSGHPPRFVVPFKKTSILPRVKSNTYFMNKIEMHGRNKAVHFRAIGSQEFVEWNLEEGEEVTFDLKDLVAMSDTLKLKSVINFRITTLILGKLFHKVVVGPGKLVLMTEGRPIISGEESSEASLAQNRIVAFSKGTRFEIDSQINLADVYMSGFYLQKMPSDLIIIDADAHGKPSLGLIQYVKKLIFPF
jgi:hypothetical protein